MSDELTTKEKRVIDFLVMALGGIVGYSVAALFVRWCG